MSGHVAVLGAGNIAQALAAHLAMSGHEVRLFNRWEQDIAPLREKGGIQLTGLVEGYGRLARVSTDVRDVVPGARAVLVATPAYAHAYMAEVCAPHLTPDQVVLLHPGTFGSALEFARIARPRALLAESAASLYIARVVAPGVVRILTLKAGVQAAALPSRDTAEALARLAPCFPGPLVPAGSVLETGINNNQAVIHCPTVLFNFTRVEAGEEWLFYRGITESVANYVEAMDAERVALGEALGIQVESTRGFMERAYGLSGMTLLEALHAVFSKGGGARGPADRNHRYIFEDLPYSAVPWASLARQLGVPMPATETLIDAFCTAYRQDLRSLGRTAEGMGLAGLSAEQIRAVVQGEC